MNGRDSDRFCWEVHPAKDRPVFCAVALLTIGIILGAIYQSTQQIIYPLISMLILLVSLAPFFHRTTYCMDSDCVSRQTAFIERRLNWSCIQRVVRSQKGVYLSCLKKECWNDRSGIYLMFGPNKEEIIARLQKYLDEGKKRGFESLSS